MKKLLVDGSKSQRYRYVCCHRRCLLHFLDGVPEAEVATKSPRSPETHQEMQKLEGGKNDDDGDGINVVLVSADVDDVTDADPDASRHRRDALTGREFQNAPSFFANLKFCSC